MAAPQKKFSSPPTPALASMRDQYLNVKKKKSKGYTLVLIPEKTGNSKRMFIPSWFLFAGVGVLTLLFGAFVAVILYYLAIVEYVEDYEKLKAENNSIRSEAAALVSRLKEIRGELQKVDQFSHEIKSVVENSPNPLDGKKKNKGKNLNKETEKDSVDSEKIVSKDALTNLNTESLEFKSLFQSAEELENKGEKQAANLEGLFSQLKEYRKQLDATPTISPVKGAITSLFGYRLSPIFGKGQMHWGLDLAAPFGAPIRAAADGIVIRSGNVDDYGIFVDLSHGYGIVTRYAHAQKISVKVGDRVKKGDLLGEVGATGRVTGPHLHYEVEVNGRRVNPSTFIKNW